MKLLTLLFSLFLFSCKTETKKSYKIGEKVIDTIQKTNRVKKNSRFIIDSFAEKKSPKNLDLKKHQIFTDTTRNSIFFSKLSNWKPSKFDIQDTQTYVSEIKKSFKLTKANFSKRWVNLRQLNDELVLYDRCDGIDKIYEIKNNTFITYGPLESSADGIFKIIKNSDEELKIELRTIKQKKDDGIIFISIKKTLFENVFLLTHFYNDNKSHNLITPFEKINQFDLVVNNCPKRKVLEFGKFEKIDFEKYK